MLAGCTSESLSGVHLLSLSYSAAASSPPRNVEMLDGNMSAVFADLAGSARLEVRASYFGLCASSPAIARGWICSRSATVIAAVIAEVSNSSANLGRDGGDPLGLVYMAGRFRTDVVFVGLQ